MTYFSKFFVVFKVVKLLENHFYLLHNLLQKNQCINVLWYCGGTFFSNVEHIGIFTFWIKIKKWIGLVSLVYCCFNFKKWWKTYYKKTSRLPLNFWRVFFIRWIYNCVSALIQDITKINYEKVKIHTKSYMNEQKISKKLRIHIP